ncbi:MAG: chromosome segregation protein SMC [Candidatus Limnocylindria bacterium]
MTAPDERPGMKILSGGIGAPNAVLKTLTLTGFKSFVHRTHLEFAPGITAIIGSNGAGKSNLADAIRWALGENNPRVLRAKKSDELIFAGSETRRGLGMAEAVLQLDNSSRRLPIEFGEIEVGRRLYRSGEAEYLVNRSRVRLRDLQDLLAGAHLAENPFVVIGQGLVDQVLALRPADRRLVIEDAAGTRRLHQRREEALSRLAKAEAELVRVTDILREIGPRVAMLTEQVARWSEYETVRADLRRRALRWYRSSFGDTAAARADAAARLAGVVREIDRLADYVAESETVTAATDEELRAAREEEERRRMAAADAAAALATIRERLAGLEAGREAVVAEHERVQVSLEALPRELGQLRARRAAVDLEAAAAARGARDSADAARAAEEDASRTRLALAEAQAARLEAERAHLAREGDLRRLADEDRALAERGDELERSRAALDADRSAVGGELDALTRGLAGSREGAADAAARVQAAVGRLDAAGSALRALEGQLALAGGQAAALAEAADRAEEELAAREGSAEAPRLPSGLRWLEERLAAPEGLALAVRAALGDHVALSAAGKGDLAEAAADGAAAFDARTRAVGPGADMARVAPGVTVLVPGAVAHVAPPPGCRRLAEVLALPDDVRAIAAAAFGDVFLAEDDSSAVRAAGDLERGTIVTASGLRVTAGAIRYPDPRSPAVLEREALERLRTIAERLRAEHVGAAARERELQAEREALARREADAEAGLTGARDAVAESEQAVVEAASRQSAVRDAIRAAEAGALAVERERSGLAERRARVASERAIAQAEAAIAAERSAAADGLEAGASASHAEASERAEAARLDAATNEERRSSLVRLRETLDEQVAASERRLADEDERLRALAEQRRDTMERLAATRPDLERAASMVRDAERSVELARERALAAEGSRRESEQRIASVRERLAGLRGERAKLEAEEERASAGLRLLEEQVRAELGLPDDEPLPDPASIDLDEDEGPAERASAVRDLQRLRRRLIALEPVNPLAASELAEIGERHAFLSTQREDLDKAIADLRSLADELATTIAEQFSATLQAVDREFGIFFERLFDGGQASLRTTDDGEEPGIDIYARPPGKRIGSLQQLSGGERALTATALLLAILRVKPAPFCVLDEVDAALDERNVGRFTGALRELTDRTQFIVITHNRGTIEAADTLYGVSMDEGGVSKVLSLRLAELDERAG